MIQAIENQIKEREPVALIKCKLIGTCHGDLIYQPKHRPRHVCIRQYFSLLQYFLKKENHRKS